MWKAFVTHLLYESATLKGLSPETFSLGSCDLNGLKEIFILSRRGQLTCTFAAAGILCFCSIQASAQHLELIWQPSDNANILGYNIYRANDPDSGFVKLGTVMHPDSIYRDVQVLPHQRYYYVATSEDIMGRESGFSNMIDSLLVAADSSVHVPFAPLTDKELALFQNRPNPFNSSTFISYKLPESSRVKLTIYNSYGEEVDTIVDEFQTPGLHQLEWYGVNRQGIPVSSGIYFIHLRTFQQATFRKMILIK